MFGPTANFYANRTARESPLHNKKSYDRLSCHILSYSIRRSLQAFPFPKPLSLVAQTELVKH